MIEIPDELLPEGVSGSAFDPVVLRAAAEAHCRHPFDHDMSVKAWVVRFLLDRFEETASDQYWRGYNAALEDLEHRISEIKTKFNLNP